MYLINHKENARQEDRAVDQKLMVLSMKNAELFEHLWNNSTQAPDETGEIVGEEGVSMGPEDYDKIENLLANIHEERINSEPEPVESEWV